MKICEVCGKEVPKGRSKFCSDACMMESRRQYHAEYRRIHRNEVLEKDRLRWREKYQRVVPTIRILVCPQCGKKFSTSNLKKIFCCKNCKDRWNTLPEDRRIDLRDPEALRKARERTKADAEQLVEQKRQADEQRRHEQYMRDRIRRTESGAVWYPVSCAEIRRIARETHRTYGEVAAEFLSAQVRCTGGSAE